MIHTSPAELKDEAGDFVHLHLHKTNSVLVGLAVLSEFSSSLWLSVPNPLVPTEKHIIKTGTWIYIFMFRKKGTSFPETAVHLMLWRETLRFETKFSGAFKMKRKLADYLIYDITFSFVLPTKGSNQCISGLKAIN